MNKGKKTKISSPQLSISLHKDAISLAIDGKVLNLSQKWTVFYALLAVHYHRHISTDDICDYHPWSHLAPDTAGRDLWRFIREQEEKHFNQRITQSPNRQATKLFTLAADITKKLQFYPNRPIIADHLRSLKNHDNALHIDISECILLMQSNLTNLALKRLKELQSQTLNINDIAHIETLITICLDEIYGISAFSQQISIIKSLLNTKNLNRLNRARIIMRLARFYTFNEEYDTAKAYFIQLRSLLSPEDGTEYCWYHINYGVFLRRIDHLDQAIYHQRLAHDSAQTLQWWYGVHAARYNLALMYISFADKSSDSSQQKYLQHALNWATKAHDLAILNRQAANKAEILLLIAQIHRKNNDFLVARNWLEKTLELQFLQPSKHDAHMSIVYQEIALVEKALNNHFAAKIARQKSEDHKQKSKITNQKNHNLLLHKSTQYFSSSK